MNLNEFISIHNYQLKDSLDGIELNRYGDGMISVTTVLQLIYDPKFDYVLRNNKEAVDKACEEGTRIHKQAEDFHTKGSGINEINKNFMLFHTLYGIESVGQEQTFIKEGVRGTVDCIGRLITSENLLGLNDINHVNHNNNLYFRNIDYKNTSKHSEKYCLQLGGYKWLNGNDGILVYGKGKLKVIEVPNYYEDLFIELKDYFFNLLNKKICD